MISLGLLAVKTVLDMLKDILVHVAPPELGFEGKEGSRNSFVTSSGSVVVLIKNLLTRQPLWDTDLAVLVEDVVGDREFFSLIWGSFDKRVGEG